MSDVKKTINYYSDFYSEIIGEQEERYIKFAMKRWSLKGYIGYKNITKNWKIKYFLQYDKKCKIYLH